MGLGINSPETVALTEGPEGDINEIENRGNGESSRAFSRHIFKFRKLWVFSTDSFFKRILLIYLL